MRRGFEGLPRVCWSIETLNRVACEQALLFSRDPFHSPKQESLLAGYQLSWSVHYLDFRNRKSVFYVIIKPPPISFILRGHITEFWSRVDVSARVDMNKS